MEVNKFNTLFKKIINKTDFEQLDLDKDNQISQKEVLIYAYQDEDLKAELDDSDIELIKDYITDNTSSAGKETVDSSAETISANISDEQILVTFLCALLQLTSLNSNDLLTSITQLLSGQEISENNTNSEIQNTSQTKPRRELKSMDEYIDIINNKYDELWEKFGGDTDEINQYINNNLGDFADIDGDGEITVLDQAIWGKYNKEYSNNAADSRYITDKNEKSQNYAQGKRKLYSVKLKNAISNKVNNSLLDFNDLEDLYTLGGTHKDLSALGVNIGTLILSKNNLNINSIAQDENWEEKFDSLCEKFGLDTNSWKTARTNKKDMIQKSVDYIKNNPENSKYAVLSPLFENYKNLVETYNKNESGISDQEMIAYFNSKSDRIEAGVKALVPAGIDINGDGIFDAKDIAEFSCDIDLDGDGKVSNQESKFLKTMKEQLKNVLWSNTANNGYYNNNKIEDLISYLDNFDESTYLKNKKSDLNSKLDTYIKTAINYDSNNGYLNNFKNGEYMIGSKRAYGFLQNTGIVIAGRLGYLDGTAGVFPANVSTLDPTVSEEKELISKTLEYGRPINTYLHYIKSADLTKEQLEEILNKINSSSASVQTQPSDIKKLVEQKLADL